MPKKPNLLNNLLRRMRETTFPERSIAYAAKKMEIAPAYLTKLENGDLEKPNEETFQTLLKWYGKEDEWAKTLNTIWMLANNGELPSDDVSVGVGRSACLAPKGKTITALFGAGYQVESFDDFITNVNESYISVYCIVNFLMRSHKQSKAIYHFFMRSAIPLVVVDIYEHFDKLTNGHCQAIYVEDTLLAFGAKGQRWSLTANETTLREWKDKFAKLNHGAKHNREVNILTINSLIEHLQRISLLAKK